MAEISHAFVLPDHDFHSWLAAVRPYLNAFERVAVIRSAGGNDLNRFRNVTAVQASGEWLNDDALAHIQRIYVNVVRVDVIQANSPNELAIALQPRIANNDRYGEQNNTPRHIFDRFILEYPTKARPARITRPFSTNDDNDADFHEGIDIHAPAGSQIMATVSGRVTAIVTENDNLNYGSYVQITQNHPDGLYIVTHAGLMDINVSLQQQVNAGDIIAKSAGDTIKLVVQKPNDGLSGFRLPDVVDPTLMVYLQNLRLRPTVSSLRIRSLPNTFGLILGTLSSTDSAETKEPHGRALAKVGVEGKWLRIHQIGKPTAFTAAWYLDAYSLDDPTEAIVGVNVTGMNLDIDHGSGRPSANQLGELGWVRLLYNVSFNPNFGEGDSRRYGNTDIHFTFNRYRPFLEAYTNAGYKVILVFTHQTYGEGQNYVWHQMNTDRWRELTALYADMCRRIAAQFAGTNLVYAYQIWNEQDTAPEHVRAAVGMPTRDYAHLLTETVRAIRTVDRQVKIITGGHVGGPVSGRNYAVSTLSQMPSDSHPDGIAFHPYGRGPSGSPFSIFGPINESVQNYSTVMPGKPLWITEWGILDRQGDNSIVGQATQYASGFINIIRDQYPGKVACAVWYAWSDGMDNGYGMVMGNGQPKQPLYDTFLGL